MKKCATAPLYLQKWRRYKVLKKVEFHNFDIFVYNVVFEAGMLVCCWFVHRQPFGSIVWALHSIKSNWVTVKLEPATGIPRQAHPLPAKMKNQISIDFLNFFVFRLRGQGFREGWVVGMLFVFFEALWFSFTLTFHCALSTWAFLVLLLTTKTTEWRDCGIEPLGLCWNAAYRQKIIFKAHRTLVNMCFARVDTWTIVFSLFFLHQTMPDRKK